MTPDPAFDDLKASVKSMLSAIDETSAKSETIDWRTVQLAQEMCRSQGYDPDMRVIDTKGAARGPMGSIPASMSVPAWTLFIEAAQAVGK